MARMQVVGVDALLAVAASFGLDTNWPETDFAALVPAAAAVAEE